VFDTFLTLTLVILVIDIMSNSEIFLDEALASGRYTKVQTQLLRFVVDLMYNK